MRMRKTYCFVKITLSINYWSGENWFAYDVIGRSNSKWDWNILVCPLARCSYGVVKINIRNCLISLGTKCFVYKRTVVSLFVPTLFSKIQLPPGRQSYIFCSPNTNFVRQGDRASANFYPCWLQKAGRVLNLSLNIDIILKIIKNGIIYSQNVFDDIHESIIKKLIT